MKQDFDSWLSELISLIGDIRINDKCVFQMYKDGCTVEEVARVIKEIY